MGSTEGENLTLTALSLRLGAETPVYRRESVTGSVGGRLSAASYGFSDEGFRDGGKLRLQSAEVHGRVGTSQVSALVGASLDLGHGLYEPTEPFNPSSDGQHAVFGQLRGEADAGPARLFAQADGSLTFTDATTLDFSDNNGTIVEVSADVDNGDLYSVQVGASVPVGPVEVGLAAFVAGRTGGSLVLTGDAPPPFDEFPREDDTQTPYGRAVGLIPSVVYRAPGGRLTVRVEGAISGFALMENAPVGITLAGETGWTTRPAVTVSVGVGL